MGFEVAVYLDEKVIQVVEVPKGGLQIGRADANGLVLPDRSISKRHARLAPDGERLLLTDLGSTGGTLVGGQKIQAVALSPGQSFQVGPYRVEVRALDLPASPDRRDTFTRALGSLGRLTALVGVSDLQAVLESILERTMELVGAAKGYVVLVQGKALSPVLVRQGTETDTTGQFSRTLCQQALESTQPVLLSAQARNTPDVIQSLQLPPAGFALAVPLVAEQTSLGVLYLEGERADGLDKTNLFLLLEKAGAIGGRALRMAMDLNQIVADRDRWRWLAAVADEEPDPSRAARSARGREVLRLVQHTAREDVTALITGESGTGKEVTALAIHRASDRRGGPFIVINCAAIPRELIESELFGHESGAFTGATGRKIGRFELAQGGTLFLDEIGDMPLELQAKLLRALETRTIERLGSATPIRWDARLLAATNRDLEAAVAAGAFRADLYYRLNVVSIRLPPLRQRVEDIEPLVQQMLLVTNRRFKRKLYGVTPEALQALEKYSWPGNVRELRNLIERCFILETTDRITPDSLPFVHELPKEPTLTLPPVPDEDLDNLPTLSALLERHEREYIQFVLRRVTGHITQAAKILGMGRTSLHRKLRHMGIDVDESGDA